MFLVAIGLKMKEGIGSNKAKHEGGSKQVACNNI